MAKYLSSHEWKTWAEEQRLQREHELRDAGFTDVSITVGAVPDRLIERLTALFDEPHEEGERQEVLTGLRRNAVCLHVTTDCGSFRMLVAYGYSEPIVDLFGIGVDAQDVQRDAEFDCPEGHEETEVDGNDMILITGDHVLAWLCVHLRARPSPS